MLSPGKWHLRVPKDPIQNLRFRKAVLQAAANNPALQRDLIRVCRQDILFFINVFVWQFNPRKGGGLQIGPFITWDFQDAAFRVMLDCVECNCHADPEVHQHDLVIEKSREMGASWMLLILFFWLWLLHAMQQFLLISRNEKAVEDENPDSLFWKIDFMLKYLPDWLKPKRLRRRKMFFGNDDLDSTINGEASTGRAGVGGRAKAMGIDEFSQIKEDYEVLHRTSDTTGCRIFNFTHLGLDTAAYELTDPNKAAGSFAKKLKLHWTQHPDKKRGMYRFNEAENKIEVLDKSYAYPSDFQFVMSSAPVGGPFPGIRSPWYDKQCERKGSSRAVAMDLDINPQGSVSQFFDPLMIHVLKATYCTEPLWVGDLAYEKDTGKFLGLVPVPDGPLKLWINPDSQGKIPPGMFAIGADISNGTGATPSCLSVTDVTTGEKVAEYVQYHLDPKQLAPVAVALCWLFKNRIGNGATFAWEGPGPGSIFGKTVMELGYREVYYRPNNQSNLLRGKGASTPGWHNTPEAARDLLTEYRFALLSRQYLNRCEEALEECLAFKYTGTGTVEHGKATSVEDPASARMNHGDRVMADALSWMLTKGRLNVVRQEEAENVAVGSLAWRRRIHDNAQRRDGWS